jgi:mannose-6-phosphate isomerase-like protein (cupin superfamily)
MIQYFKLPVQFDAARLLQEANGLTAGLWKQHYNTRDYEGSWSVIPLRSFMGLLEANFSIPVNASGENRYGDTELMQYCPYIQEALQWFQCEKTAVRLMNLAAGAVIKEHCDDALNLEAGEARLHIPVQTNPQVAFYVADEQVPLQAGECWYLNLSLPHKVHNLGSTDRIHLVIDCLVNDWLLALLDQPGIIKKEMELAERQPAYLPGEKEQIIAQLKSMGTDVANELAARMEAGI